MTGPALQVRMISSLDEITAAQWDACANPDYAVYNPFVDFRFLSALEHSASVGEAAGWLSYHLLLEADGKVVGAVPMYLKTHSRGEYVFDQNWAEALQRAGANYYPKLQISVPFTPATGRRFLVSDDYDQNLGVQQLASGCVELAKRLEVSSIHATFMPLVQSQQLQSKGWLQRQDQQFHWLNDDYAVFDDFLAALSSKKRKNIKRERRLAVANDIEIIQLTGSDIEEAHWDAFYQFYVDTGNRKWGSPYLTRDFFSRIGATMGDAVLLIMCKREGRFIAGAINFIGGDTLYGRNWGCIEDHEFLHFEVCYYQAIEFAIAKGLRCVEAGAQGAHKLARGYVPTLTYSGHWISNESFRDAIAHYLDQEKVYVAQEKQYLDEHQPFRNLVESQDAPDG